MTTTINASTTAGLVQTADTSGVLALQTANTTAVTIDASQNSTFAGTITTTGITNSGVATATRFNPTGSSVTGNGMYLPAANSLGLSTNGTNAVYIDSSQKVGIGTASPTDKLTVSASVRFGATSSNRILYLGQSSPADNGAGSLEFQVSNTVKNWAIRTNNNVAGALEFCPSTTAGGTTYTTPSMLIDSSGNVSVKATSAPSGVTADTFFLLTAGTGTLGTASASGYIVYTKTIAQGVATTLITPADIDKWAGVIFISYVRDADQNRSGMMMVRYAYNRTYTTLIDSSQNSGATFSVSANNLQVTLGGAGNYYCEIQIWGGAGP